jgi:hypothetical protein
VEADTLDVRPLPGVVLKHFKARDVVSRWDGLEAHTRANSHTATAFMDTLLKRMPFPVKVIQVDGGLSLKTSLRRNARDEAQNIRSAAALTQAQWRCGKRLKGSYRRVP